SGSKGVKRRVWAVLNHGCLTGDESVPCRASNQYLPGPVLILTLKIRCTSCKARGKFGGERGDSPWFVYAPTLPQPPYCPFWHENVPCPPLPHVGVDEVRQSQDGVWFRP